jgi:hypothetical protein
MRFSMVTIKSDIFRDVMPSDLIKSLLMYQRNMLCLLGLLLGPEDKGNTFSEMSVNMCQSIWNHILRR